MALTTVERHTLFESLTDVIGSEKAALLLDQFPAKEGDELVTTTQLDLALARLEGRIDARFAESQAALELAVTRLEARIDASAAALRAEVAHVEHRMYVTLVGLVTVATGIIVTVGR